MKRLLFCLVFAPALMLGCAHFIPGTQIADTADTRAVLAVLGKMRTALEARDADALIALVSHAFFEDLGDDNPSNDYGYRDLQERILPQSLAVAKEIHVDFDIHDIVISGDHATADIRYRSRAQLDLPAGTRWDSHREFDRIEMVREQSTWKIVKGL